jgi:hypothetical protein
MVVIVADRIVHHLAVALVAVAVEVVGSKIHLGIGTFASSRIHLFAIVMAIVMVVVDYLHMILVGNLHMVEVMMVTVAVVTIAVTVTGCGSRLWLV